eukprot:gnl/TRDRNA2_/TRDRNA2_164135_c0_seq1.p1 gnl/TRDRNA2_/TRDRNA2_164135_c0~~gnl/TRDRNA2_/TRDRNA2_164135_c0_seq1.p1  ORF type:complete len:372 (+),score=58.53 gnl/TRDRNA2_/TRDRNA2_164135_c0_seq1:31-1146(+)
MPDSTIALVEQLLQEASRSTGGGERCRTKGLTLFSLAIGLGFAVVLRLVSCTRGLGTWHLAVQEPALQLGQPAKVQQFRQPVRVQPALTRQSVKPNDPSSRHHQDEFSRATQALVEGKPIAILDAPGREGETDMYFAAHRIRGEDVSFMREHGRGELYFSLGHNVHSLFAMPYMANFFDHVSTRDMAHDKGNEESLELGFFQHMRKGMDAMVQGQCSVGPSFDFRDTKTGATDEEIAITMRKFAELYQEVAHATGSDLSAQQIKQNQVKLGTQFHTPGHIFSVLERPAGLRERDGHTELSVAVARAAGVPEIMVGTVMVEKSLKGLTNKNPDSMYNKVGTSALGPEEAKAVCDELHIPWLDGENVKNHVIS